MDGPERGAVQPGYHEAALTDPDAARLHDRRQ